MTRSFAALLLVIASSQFSSVSDAQIFKCQINGKVNYSDQPCATGSQRLLSASPNSAGSAVSREETTRREKADAKVDDSARTSGSSGPGQTVKSKRAPTAAECHARNLSAAARTRPIEKAEVGTGNEQRPPGDLDVDLTQCTTITKESPAGPRVAAPQSATAVQIPRPAEQPAFPGEPTSDRARPIRASPIPFGSGVSAAPLPRDFTVVGLQNENRMVTLRSQKGVIADVYVGERVYDISQLKPGMRIKVDFALPNEGDTRIRAASVWPIETEAQPK